MKFVYHKHRDEVGISYDFDKTEDTCSVNFGSGDLCVSTDMLKIVDEIVLMTTFNFFRKSYIDNTAK